jgi:hypothetical protein
MLSNDLKRVADEVRGLQSSRALAVAALKETDGALGAFDVLEKGLRLRTIPVVPSGRVVAVDGGIVAQEFHGIDLFLVRACAVAFDYENGKVKSYNYHPSRLPPYAIHARHSLQSHEFAWFNGLLRLESELSCAIAAAEKFSPKVLLLDGSIMPQVSDRPARESPAYSAYEDVLDKFKQLYTLSQKQGFWLAGVIKDSRGRHFLDLIASAAGGKLKEFSQVLERTNDTVFLYDLLAEGERTPAFKYSSAASEHVVLRDLGDWSRKIASFYVKPAPFDRPLRVDFLLNGTAADIPPLADLICALSKGNKSYAYPAVLIEADMQAAMNPDEARFFSDALFATLGRGPDLMELRRNSRPFR